MRFSILIPVYNVEHYVNECISSIEAQNFLDYEVIMVDDGSKDISGQICDEYAKRDTRVHVIHKTNEGLLLARRTAIKAAKGEYFIFVDSDDFMEPNALDLIEKAILNTNADLILYNANLILEDKKEIFYENLFEEMIYAGSEKKVFFLKMVQNFSINGMWLKAVNRKIVDIEKDYSTYSFVSNGEDLLQSLALFDRAETIFYMNKCLYNYRINNLSMTQNYSENYFISFKYTFKMLIEYLDKWEMFEYTKHAFVLFLNRVFEDIVQSCGVNSPLNNRQKIEHLKRVSNDTFLQEAYLKGKKINPMKRSKIGLYLLMRHKYRSVILLERLWEIWHKR